MSFSVDVSISSEMLRAMNPERGRVAILQGNRSIGLQMRRTIRDGIRGGTKTGRIYNFRGRKHRSSAPGEYPANRSGNLAKSISFRVYNTISMEVGSQDVKYAPILQQFETPDDRISNFTKIAPRPFLTLAHDENEPYFILEMANSISSELGL